MMRAPPRHVALAAAPVAAAEPKHPRQHRKEVASKSTGGPRPPGKKRKSMARKSSGGLVPQMLNGVAGGAHGQAGQAASPSFHRRADDHSRPRAQDASLSNGYRQQQAYYSRFDDHDSSSPQEAMPDAHGSMHQAGYQHSASANQGSLTQHDHNSPDHHRHPQQLQHQHQHHPQQHQHQRPQQGHHQPHHLQHNTQQHHHQQGHHQPRRLQQRQGHQQPAPQDGRGGSQQNHELLTQFQHPANAAPREDTQGSPPQQNQGSSLALSPNQFTRINGKGIWHSWTRNFKTPLLACLDLIDNSLDAALSPGFAGRVHVERADMTMTKPGVGFSGISITNNSVKPIRPLTKVLEVYNSTKSGKGDTTIGENGVGLKQGCATLADTSFVLTRNGSQLSLGILAKSLQKDEGCMLPSFRIDMIEGEDVTLPQQQEHIKNQLWKIAKEDPGVRLCFLEYGRQDVKKGIHLLLWHFYSLLNDGWGEHCFRVILTDLKHGGGGDSDDEDGQQRSVRSEDKATSLMDELAEALPYNYIHIPPAFDFRVNKIPLKFSYWQRRLVELSRFTVRINTDRLLHTYGNDAQGWKEDGYPLKIYAGFDCMRLCDEHEGKMCKLLIYSRESGRLIKSYKDARNELGLSAGGTDYAQGLTIIVDDADGKLPLNPTKQDLAFGEETNGKKHETNLFSWIGGVTWCYWRFHFENFGATKGGLTKAVQMKFEDVAREQLEEDINTPPLDSADLSSFTDVDWTKKRKKNSANSTDIRTNMSKRRFVYQIGSDTTFRMEKPSAELLALERNKRKRTKETNKIFERDEDDSSDEKNKRIRTEDTNKFFAEDEEEDSSDDEQDVAKTRGAVSQRDKAASRSAKKRRRLIVRFDSERAEEVAGDDMEDGDAAAAKGQSEVVQESFSYDLSDDGDTASREGDDAMEVVHQDIDSEEAEDANIAMPREEVLEVNDSENAEDAKILAMLEKEMADAEKDREMKRQFRELCARFDAKEKELKAKDELLAANEKALENTTKALEEKTRQCEAKDETLEAKQRELEQKNKELSLKDAKIANLMQKNETMRRMNIMLINAQSQINDNPQGQNVDL